MLKVIFVLIVIGGAVCLAQTADRLEVGRFSVEAEGSAPPNGWDPLTFKKVERHTTYQLVRDGATVVVKAISEAATSGLIKKVTIDPQEYPIVRWF